MRATFVLGFARDLLRTVRHPFAGLIALSLLAGTLQGIGIFMLFPLLNSAGVVAQDTEKGRIFELFDQVLTTWGLQPSLAVVLLVFLLLMLLRNGTLRWESVLGPRIEHSYIKTMRRRLFDAIIAVDWQFYARQRPAHITQALTSDIDRIGQGVYVMNRLISQSLLMAAYGTSAILIDWKVTLWVALAGAVAVVIQQRMAGRAYVLGRQLSDQEKDLYHWIRESLLNLKLIKTSDNASHVKHHFEGINQANKDAYLNTTRHYADLNFFFQAYSAVILVVFLYLAVRSFQLPSASLLVLVFVFSRMMPLVSGIWTSTNHLIHTQPAFENYTHLVQSCESRPEHDSNQIRSPLELRQGIRLKDLHFQFEGTDREILRGIDLDISAGKITALVGMSGAGKTTICDLVAGLLKPNSGEILLDDQPLASQYLAQWRSQVIYLTQDPLLFNASLRQNLRWYHPDASDAQLTDALVQAQLGDWFAQLEAGLETMVGDRGTSLSGGERQRLALARAFLARPTLLILDEPSSTLDVVNERKIVSALQRFREHSTLIIIAHRLSSLKIADQIMVLEDGRVTDRGDWTSLSRRPGLFSELLQSS